MWHPRSILRRIRSPYPLSLSGFARRLYRRLMPRPAPPHPFDLAHGTDTGGLVPTQSGPHPNAAQGTAYWGTAPSLLRGLLSRWVDTLQGTPYQPADYTFIDIGSGKGRALLLASELPFRRVTGLELDPALHAVAQRNLHLWQHQPYACTQIEAIQADALTLTPPETPAVLYLFNPFSAAVIVGLLDRLAEFSTPGAYPIDILYARPEHSEIFTRTPGLQLLWDGEVPFTPEDTAADIFDTTQQRCHIYRIVPRGTIKAASRKCSTWNN